MTSINFGLAHWDGHQGGLWAWLMHAAGDVIIFVVVFLRVG